MITKYKLNELVYDTLNKKCYKIRGITIRNNGTYYCLEFDNENTIIRAEKSIRKCKIILDKEETRYLNDVIRPFKNKVTYIKKLCYLNQEHLVIQLDYDYFYLPYFKKGTMYKNMETDKRYTLEDLHLI